MMKMSGSSRRFCQYTLRVPDDHRGAARTRTLRELSPLPGQRTAGAEHHVARLTCGSLHGGHDVPEARHGGDGHAPHGQPLHLQAGRPPKSTASFSTQQPALCDVPQAQCTLVRVSSCSLHTGSPCGSLVRPRGWAAAWCCGSLRGNGDGASLGAGAAQPARGCLASLCDAARLDARARSGPPTHTARSPPGLPPRRASRAVWSQRASLQRTRTGEVVGLEHRVLDEHVARTPRDDLLRVHASVRCSGGLGLRDHARGGHGRIVRGAHHLAWRAPKKVGDPWVGLLRPSEHRGRSDATLDESRCCCCVCSVCVGFAGCVWPPFSGPLFLVSCGPAAIVLARPCNEPWHTQTTLSSQTHAACCCAIITGWRTARQSAHTHAHRRAAGDAVHASRRPQGRPIRRR